MSDSRAYITFFPGQGICSMPDGKVIISVAGQKEAQAIFEEISSRLLGKDGIELSQEAERLYRFYKEHFGDVITATTGQEDLVASFTQDAHAAGTRTSFGNAKPIDWAELEKHLATLGYTLAKRQYLDGALDGICNVYTLTHAETGVIAEGKGIDDAQACRSALAEGVERIAAGDHDRAAKSSIVTRQIDLPDKTAFDFGEGPRDLFTDKILAEWIPALNVSTGARCWMPTELAYFQYEPRDSHIKNFSLTHTMGLASGSSIEDATLSGLFEVLERDAYWIIMRNRINCPDINLAQVSGLDPKVQGILTALAQKGYSVSLKDASLDWGVAIAHAVLSDNKGRIPAFAHGMGAGFDWATAIARAVTEVVQVHSGLHSFTQEHGFWKEVVGAAGVLGRPELAWADPLFRPHIEHLLSASVTKSAVEVKVTSPPALIQELASRGHEVMLAKLGSMGGLEAVRVLVSGTTHPDERLERMSKRLSASRDLNGKGFYSDPILT